MRIHGSRLPTPIVARPRPAAGQTASPSGDTVSLSRPRTDRSWFWKSLQQAVESATASSVGGATGLALTQAHHQAVVEVVRELNQVGVEFYQNRSGLSRLLGKERHLDGNDVFDELTSSDIEAVRVRISPEKDYDYLRSLRQLESLDVGLLGAEPVTLDRGRQLEAAHRLWESGFDSGSSKLSYLLDGRSASFERDGHSYSGWSTVAADYFRGSGLEDLLEKPDLARELKQLESQKALMGNDPVGLYESAERGGQPSLSWAIDKTTFQLAKLATPDPEGLHQALDQARDGLAFVQTELIPALGEKELSGLPAVYQTVSAPCEGHTRSSQLNMVKQLFEHAPPREDRRLSTALSRYEMLRKRFDGDSLKQAVGLTCSWLGRTNRAAEQAIMFGRLKPENPLSRVDEATALGLLGRIEKVIGRGDDAETLLHKASLNSTVETLPDHVDLLNLLAYHQKSQASFRRYDLERDYEKVLATGKSASEASHAIGQATLEQLHQGRPERILAAAIFALKDGTSEQLASISKAFDTLFASRKLDPRDWTGTSEALLTGPLAPATLERALELGCALLVAAPAEVLSQKQEIRQAAFLKQVDELVEMVKAHPQTAIEDLAKEMTTSSAVLETENDLVRVGGFEVKVEV
ncbi:MAG: hypothetical protein KC910_03290 [Candidatus Eremiobacteraeota bacterium]|nr:hypothetical protein [Candidatus Eremiobacteraeota bacterium]